jgi:hypothetical protein
MTQDNKSILSRSARFLLDVKEMFVFKELEADAFAIVLKSVN